MSPYFLLVRQQLDALIRLSHSPQRRSMRFEHLRFIGSDIELHHQYPAKRSPLVVASTSRAPPVALLLLSIVIIAVPCRNPTNVVLQGETVAMRANIRQSDSSHSIDWRDDPLQEVSAFPSPCLLMTNLPDLEVRKQACLVRL